MLDIDDRRTAEYELRQERDRLAALHRAATDIDSANTESEVYETVAEVADEILDFTIVTVSIVEDDTFVLKARSLDGTGEAFEEVSLDTDTLAARSYKRGETIVADDLSDYDVTPADDGYASALTVPIGEYGVFQAVSREADGFDDTDRELAELLVDHALHCLERPQPL